MKKRTSGADSLTDPRLAELREAFRQCDADKDGAIGYAEFVLLLRNLDAETTAQEAKIGFQAIDTDDDQRIDFGEFADWWGEG